MKQTNTTNLDTSKQRALRHLSKKEEIGHHYPIDSINLIELSLCPLCSSPRSTRISEVYLARQLLFFATDTCQDCTYTFRSISPSLAWFQKCWKKIAKQELEVFNPETEEIRLERYRKYIDMLQPFTPSGSTVLDVGAGYGTGLNVFKEKGYDVEALEPEDSRAYYIENALSIQTHRIPIEIFLNTQQKKYDLVLFAHCLEHLDDPAVILNKLKPLVRPQGILYLEVPIFPNYGSWFDALYLTHKSNFTEKNILDLAQLSGFSILEKTYVLEDGFNHLGIILSPHKTTEDAIKSPANHTLSVDEVRKIFRKDLPIPSPSPDSVLRYNVDGIEQFYTTLRLNSKKMVAPKSADDFIVFANV